MGPVGASSRLPVVKRGVATISIGLLLGLAAGVGAAGCGEDRGSVDVEGGTTGGTVGTSTAPETTGTTGTTETTETTGTTGTTETTDPTGTTGTTDSGY